MKAAKWRDLSEDEIRAEGAGADGGALQPPVPALHGSGQEPVARRPGPARSGAGQDDAARAGQRSRERGRKDGASGGDEKTRKAWWCSDAMQKTRVVQIERVYRHPRYQRVVRHVQEAEGARRGEREQRRATACSIEETRPLSRRSAGGSAQIVSSRSEADMIQPTLDARCRGQLRGQKVAVHPRDGRGQQALPPRWATP